MKVLDRCPPSGGSTLANVEPSYWFFGFDHKLVGDISVFAE